MAGAGANADSPDLIQPAFRPAVAYAIGRDLAAWLFVFPATEIRRAVIAVAYVHAIPWFLCHSRHASRACSRLESSGPSSGPRLVLS
jgi:hypothetical protein